MREFGRATPQCQNTPFQAPNYCYVVHPVQAVLDYPAAYAAMGLAGLWHNSKIASLILAGLAQFICHVCAGAIFAAYAPAGTILGSTP